MMVEVEEGLGFMPNNKTNRIHCPKQRLENLKNTNQEWTNRTLVGHEPLICSKMCYTKKNRIHCPKQRLGDLKNDKSMLECFLQKSQPLAMLLAVGSS